MLKLTPNLVLPRCPHCGIADPNLFRVHGFQNTDHEGGSKKTWSIYQCGHCGRLVTAAALQNDGSQVVVEYYPQVASIKEDVPERPRLLLQQALESLHAPSGAVMLAASAVDAMLKLKNYKEGSLYGRIQQAVADHVITNDMAEWAHDVRLDANDERHADESAKMPTTDDAKRVVDFATALAEILFVLPGRVQRGIRAAAGAQQQG